MSTKKIEKKVEKPIEKPIEKIETFEDIGGKKVIGSKTVVINGKTHLELSIIDGSTTIK